MLVLKTQINEKNEREREFDAPCHVHRGAIRVHRHRHGSPSASAASGKRCHKETQKKRAGAWPRWILREVHPTTDPPTEREILFRAPRDKRLSPPPPLVSIPVRNKWPSPKSPPPLPCRWMAAASSALRWKVSWSKIGKRGDRFTFSALRFLERDCSIVGDSLNVVEDSRVFKNLEGISRESFQESFRARFSEIRTADLRISRKSQRIPLSGSVSLAESLGIFRNLFVLDD